MLKIILYALNTLLKTDEEKKTKKVCHFKKHILSIVTRMSISVNALIISSFKLREENGNLEIMFILTMKLLDNRAVGL